ncbi:pheST operon leader peptide PheM [Escherichia coli]|nr:pheST operon leader peptide PheM [Erwinia endophytica]MEB7336950.1 pheST operon leader peptide PheM [Escherichia coli]MEB7350780.1 pheST operon leader peptide PheM [Escherichia coli]MEB7416240.1 pheST operon leader peptide PheM [Escherichia coli]
MNAAIFRFFFDFST